MPSPNNKRALKESADAMIINASDLDVDKSSKKIKREESKASGKFYENEIPNDVFPIGDSVFVFPSTFRGVVSVHIRKYQKYGMKYYPTSEGITLRPWWIEQIMDRETVPQNENHLRSSVFLPESEIQITSKDFKVFTFTRVKQGWNSKSLTISAEQYNNMLRNYNNIANAVLDHMFRIVNFLDVYRNVFDGIIEETLPSSFDVSLGTQHLLETLENAVRDIFKEKNLKEPCILAEELWANRVETFNSHAFSLEILEIADSFYHSLRENEPFLALKPAMYVTVDFLKNLPLDTIIRSVRNALCPEDAFEYFENNE